MQTLKQGPSGRRPEICCLRSRSFAPATEQHLACRGPNLAAAMQFYARTRCSSTALSVRPRLGPGAVAAAPRLWHQHQSASRQRMAACADCLTGSLDDGTPKGEDITLAGVPCYIRCALGQHFAQQYCCLMHPTPNITIRPPAGAIQLACPLTSALDRALLLPC